ncbi:MAG: phosphoenolpyruvate carboxykinase domain-containing protein, partial [bacterium]
GRECKKEIFGRIRGVNSKDDPVLGKVFQSMGEITFSNELVAADKSVYWIGKDKDAPAKGFNYSGA